MLKHLAISPQNMCQRSRIMRDIVLFGQKLKYVRNMQDHVEHNFLGAHTSEIPVCNLEGHVQECLQTGQQKNVKVNIYAVLNTVRKLKYYMIYNIYL